MDRSLALLDTLVRWLGPVFDDLGYVLVPVAVVLETSALIGWVVPGDVILALGGVYAVRGSLELAIMLLGYVFGENLPLLDRVLSRYGWVGLALLLGLVGAWIVRRRLQRRRAA